MAVLRSTCGTMQQTSLSSTESASINMARGTRPCRRPRGSARTSAAAQTKKQARQFIEDHDAFLFDCDGVLWRGEDGLLPGTIETLDLLEQHGKRQPPVALQA